MSIAAAVVRDFNYESEHSNLRLLGVAVPPTYGPTADHQNIY